MTLERLPPRPGPKYDASRKAIMDHLRENKSVVASMNIGSLDYRSALGSLIREQLVTIDRDFNCTITKKGEDSGV